MPDTINKIVLNFDNTIKNGILDSSPAKIAPAPTATNIEGRAQQNKVPKLVNKLKEGIIRLFIVKGFII